MRPPDLLTETDFLAREFPAPANPLRPLAVLSPEPGAEGGSVARQVEAIAGLGYGGIVLDPAASARQFLGEAWFDLAGEYIEAARLAGLALWLLDGFTNGEVLAAILDEAVPGWRGAAITTARVTVQGPDRLVWAPPEPEVGRLLGASARPLDAEEPPQNLYTSLKQGSLQWDAPPGRWEVLVFQSERATGPAHASFNWADGSFVSSWLAMGFDSYRELFGPHLGRTIRGFFVFCPTWREEDAVKPLLTPTNPTWTELVSLSHPDNGGQPYFSRAVEAISRSYLAPVREWCWHNRLQFAGYRLGGRPLPGLMADFDLGGLPDLSPGAFPDRSEVAGLTGLARYYRQERVASQMPLTGEMIRDRTTISGLAAAGANLFLARPPEELPAGCIAAINDFAARVAMAVSAGGPLEEAALVIKEDPRALHEVGSQAEALAAKGIESICLPAAESVSLGEVNAHNAAISLETTAIAAAETAATGLCPDLPPGFAMRARKVENWSVYTLFNLGEDRWLGLVGLPVLGATETWFPANGEQRSTPVVAAETGMRIPVAVGPGEAVLAIVRRPGLPRSPAKNRWIRAHLRLDRSWAFEAKGGNVLPLNWREETAGNWTASLFAQTVPADLRLAGGRTQGDLRLNGEPLAGEELGRLLQSGENQFELRGERRAPQVMVTGSFACRGEAGIAPAPEISGPWTLNGYPYFRGPGIYRQTIQVPAELVRDDLEVWLEIGALAESAAIRLNGQPAGFLAWPPYRLHLGRASRLTPGGNPLEIEVYAAASRAPWSFKGLLGEVSLIFIEAEPDKNEEWPF